MSPKDGEEPAGFKPYVSPSESLPEFTFKAAIAGMIFGMLFGAANAYLGLVAGLTISTSIPIAVMTVAAFRTFSLMGAKSSILEANLTQTVGSASSSVASGVIFTLPALFMWGFDPGFAQMTVLAMSGGLLGVLFMIPLRSYLIEKEHGKLPYPEGTACSEVLRATEVGGAKAATVFGGLGVGLVLKFLTGWLHAFPATISFKVPFLPKGNLGTKVSAALFGVGYILGPRIASIMVGGALLSSLVLIPGVAIWGDERSTPLYPETVALIRDMPYDVIWTRYVRYIGAGAVAMAGLMTLFKSIPTMIKSFRLGATQLKSQMGSGEVAAVPRTQQDLPLKVVAAGVAAIVFALVAVPGVFGVLENPAVRIVAALMVAFCAFFFVTVSSRIVGLVGVTSNPTSGMTIASLLATSSIFLLFGWQGDFAKVAALTVGCVIAIAASIAGDTSQDLKTGFLLGATPRKQQLGELLGVFSSAWAVAMVIIVLDRSYGFGSQELPAPQATLMKVVIEGVLENSLPWTLVLIGVGIAVVIELCKLPSLAFAVGVYLPVTTLVPVFLGGMLRLYLEKRAANAEEKRSRRDRGILFGSGLVGGAGLTGVAIAGVAFVREEAPEGIGYDWAGPYAQAVALVALAGLILLFVRVCTGRESTD